MFLFQGDCSSALLVVGQLAVSSQVRMPTSADSSVLADVVSRVLAAGASEFEVEYKDGHERVFVLSGPVGMGLVAYRSETREAQSLRRALYERERHPKKLVVRGVECKLRVEIFDSFGEDAFRVTVQKS